MAPDRRLNPGIRPTDLVWEKIYAMFEYQVRISDKTLGDILLEHFTVFEVRMFFKQERPDLKALQEQNTTRYHELLNDRFAKVPSSLHTKLTMMFFGLPIEPVNGTLEGKPAKTLADLESEVAQMKPLVFLKDDDLTRVSFGTVGLSQVNANGAENPEKDAAVSGLEHPDVPITSKSVLTVREQVNLLNAFRTMRDIAVKRSFPCPFEDCKYVFDPTRPDDAKTHIARLHVSKRCIWCNETHFEWWTTAQRQHHLRHKHRDELFEALGVENLKLSDNNETETFSITLTRTNSLNANDPNLFASRNAPSRHPIEYFCDSCGRDNRNFTAVYEKEYHDRSCRNKNVGDKKRTFCVECGEYGSTGSHNASQLDGQVPPCGHSQNTAVGQFCILCGIDTDRLGNFAEAHRTSCRGNGSAAKRFCPFCGDRLASDDHTGDVTDLIRNHRAECYTDGPKPRQARGRSPTPPRKSFVSRLAGPLPSEAIQPAAIARVDLEAERGRPQKQAKKKAPAAKKRKEKAVESSDRRRAPSPDWAVVLGDPDPSFVPDNNYYCSKCLRRVPKPNRRRNAKATINVEHEYLQHIAEDRCCRIRNGVGSDENLPNRSGWIPAKLVSKIGVMKSKFLTTHPAYKATLYPLLPADARTNMWRSDPNNETNSENWNLPWPPYIGSLPETSDETSDVDMADVSSDESSFKPGEGDGSKKGKRRVRNEDGSYSYETGSDSDSEPEASGKAKRKGKRKRRVRHEDYSYETDPDSASESEAGVSGKKKGRRRVRHVRNEDGTYSYETDPDSTSDLEESGRARKKGKRRVRHEGGVWYSYETDPDSASEPKAGGSGKKKGKRRVRRLRNEDGTYTCETDPDSDSELEGTGHGRKKWKRRVRNEDGTYSYETDSDFDSDLAASGGVRKNGMRHILTADGEWSYVSGDEWEDALSTDDDGLSPNRRRRRRRRFGDPTYQPPRKGEESDSDHDLVLEKVREELLQEIQGIQDEEGAVESPRFMTPGGLQDFVVRTADDN